MEVLRGLRCVRRRAGMAGNGCTGEENNEAQGLNGGSKSDWRGCSRKGNYTRAGTRWVGKFSREKCFSGNRPRATRVSSRVAADNSKRTRGGRVYRDARHFARRTLQSAAPYVERTAKRFRFRGTQDGIVWPRDTGSAGGVRPWRACGEEGGGKSEASGRDNTIAGGRAQF